MTIPDVVVVVDTGRVKEARGNFRVKGLKETWISKASAKQVCFPTHFFLFLV